MDKHELDAHNSRIIKEFRANGGKVGGMYDGMPLLLLHHLGARTGAQRTNPMVYQQLGEQSFAVFGSAAAAPTHPDWYHNLRAHPRTVIEVGSRTVDVLARVADGAERERIWSRQKELNPLFADFEKRTTRQIPVVVLDTV